MEITLHWEIDGQSEQLTVTDFDIANRPVYVGRSQSCQVVIADLNSSVSRRHAEIFLQDDDFHLRNLSQRSVTYINGRRLGHNQTAPIKSGFLVRLGRITLQVGYRPPETNGKFMINCSHPDCDRLVNPALDQCPWDGTVLFWEN